MPFSEKGIFLPLNQGFVAIQSASFLILAE
jgi:hypothetical protein